MSIDRNIDTSEKVSLQSLADSVSDFTVVHVVVLLLQGGCYAFKRFVAVH